MSSDRQHALLSPSSAARWLKCTKSAKLEEDFPDEDTIHTKTGTLAHAVAELYLTKQFTRMRKTTFDKKLAELKKDPLFDEDMCRHAESYRDYIKHLYEELSSDFKPIVEIERSIDLSSVVPESFGTCDCVLISEPHMEVIDYKYGQGVAVEAKDNPQLLLYALGALLLFDPVYTIETIGTTIYQPRLGKVDRVEITAQDLRYWAETIKPQADLAFKGEGQYMPGEDTCRFCKAKSVCRARAAENLKLAELDFRDPDLMSLAEIAEILPKLKDLVAWARDVEDYALKEARDHDKTVPGYKLVEGRSIRRYTSEIKAMEALMGAGYTPDVYLETKLLGITALEKALGAEEFSRVLDGFIDKPAGKPTLVPESDTRPAISSLDQAIKDFKEI